jgi:hypothetical protein
MAGILDSIDSLLGTRLGLLVSDPRAALAEMNQQAGAFNQASLLATQAERNAIRGRPVTPEQAAAKQYVDKVNEDLAMGFAGTTIGKPLNNPANTLERMSPWFVKYQKAGDVVDGLNVGKEVKNMSSIPATFGKYEIEKGIKSVPMSDFPSSSPYQMFRSKDDIERVKNLAEQIKKNKYIDPLIVAVDKEGSYVLEGGHRLGALNLLGIKNFPAVVVRDLDY